MLDTRLKDILRTTSRHHRRLEDMGIRTARDLLEFFPRTYEDQSQFGTVADIRTDEKNVLKGTIGSFVKRRTRTGKLLISALFTDQTGSIEVIWFNQPYVMEVLKSGDEVILAGKAKFAFGKTTLPSPSYEKVGQTQVHTARIVPVYPESLPVTSKWLREKIYSMAGYFSQFQEYLPEEVRERERLLDYQKAMKEVHFPANRDMLIRSRERLAFDEVFVIQLLALQKRWEWIKGYKEGQSNIVIAEDFLDIFEKKLPFELTGAQQRAIGEIFEDLQKPYPMLRLLQGDVGSGKTVVAAAALLATVGNGLQGAIMAPTEILAKQHFKSLSELFAEMDGEISIEILTGSLSPKEKQEIADRLKVGDIDIIVGTHALIQDYVDFKNLGLAVIDEQHRFGVKQRDRLKSFGNPNLLNMTATPIPRTLAMTLYGDQDVSILDEMPKGRKKIITRIVPEHKRREAYLWIHDQVQKGRQVFVICPLVEESEVLEVKAATEEYLRLQNEIFPDLKLGLIHGRMAAEEKDQVMKAFGANEIQLLVSTSVIEVGIDVPNATIMMIEGADRFGLAQLHQFRGRVGRGVHQSYCFLLPAISAPESLKRLRALEEHHSGFELAEIDLRERGPGQLYGLRQSGMPDLKMASLGDTKLIVRARNEAIRIVKEDPELKAYEGLRHKLENFREKYEISVW